MFSLHTDLTPLREKIVEVGNMVLVLSDPIFAFLGVGKVDSYRTTDVRAVLGPVADFAAELKVAMIGIMPGAPRLRRGQRSRQPSQILGASEEQARRQRRRPHAGVLVQQPRGRH